MCRRSPLAECPIGALPPIIEMRVIGGEIVSAKVSQRMSWETENGKLVLVPGKPLGRLGFVRTVDPLGETVWEVRESGGFVYATQRAAGKDWVHFLDSLSQDVSPYVHAAVARLVAELAGIQVRRPKISDDACCVSCKAFRQLPGPDVELGDYTSWFPSLSTTSQREEGPWQAERYWCSAIQETPGDIVYLVNQCNELAKRGQVDPVLPLTRAGENCPLFLSKKTGRHGGIPSWEIHAGYAAEPDIIHKNTTHTLRVRGAQWEVVLSLTGKSTERKQETSSLPCSIKLRSVATGQERSFALAEQGNLSRGVLSYKAPLVQAALKVNPGEEFTVRAPGGSYRMVRIA